MIAHAQAHCNSGSAFRTMRRRLGPILDQPHHGGQGRAALGRPERAQGHAQQRQQSARPPRAGGPGDAPPARRPAAWPDRRDCTFNRTEAQSSRSRSGSRASDRSRRVAIRPAQPRVEIGHQREPDVVVGRFQQTLPEGDVVTRRRLVAEPASSPRRGRRRGGCRGTRAPSPVRNRARRSAPSAARPGSRAGAARTGLPAG